MAAKDERWRTHTRSLKQSYETEIFKFLHFVFKYFSLISEPSVTDINYYEQYSFSAHKLTEGFMPKSELNMPLRDICAIKAY